MGRADGPRRSELEFLPEVLEVQHTPPSPIGRATTWTVMAVVTAAVVWASVSRVDVVVVAPGKLIPSGHSKVVQPLESGIIRAIRVREGQAVRQGQILLELDPTTSEADLSRLAHEHLAAQLDAERLRALIAGRYALDAPKGIDPKLAALQRQRLLDERSEHESRLEAARLLVEQRQAALEATRADSQRLEMIVPMLAERAAAYKKLLESEFVGRLQYLEVEQQRVEKVQELAITRHRLSQDLAALGEARQQAQVIEMEFKRNRLAELAAVETRAASLSQEVIKASLRARIQRLVAPIAGAVQQLAVHTVGGVVTPAQALMVIVPGADRLEVEAMIENKDIGFVRAGQPAEVKIETFLFTRYGTINGRVTTVSSDAVPLERGGLAYMARLGLDRSTLVVDGKQVNLSAGMAVTAEIKTDTRRVIEFFLSPVLRYAKESARER
jgi:membrane fusion protein, hemolysin D